MKIVQVILISLSFIFLVIGVDQTIRTTFQESYFLFMFMLVCFFGYTYLKGTDNLKNKQEKKGASHTKKKP